MQKWNGSFLSEWKVLFLSIWILVFASAERPIKEFSGSPRGYASVHAMAVADLSNAIADLPNADAGKERPSPMAWMTIQQATEKLKIEKRPVLIDLYTTWCGWCKQMDHSTYSNKQVAAYLQSKFYPVKLDAETRDVISWNGRNFPFSPEFRSNEFAVYLTGGRLEFPTTIIIPPGGDPQAIPGYMSPKELELLVKYFGEGSYNTVSFDLFQKQFKSSW